MYSERKSETLYFSRQFGAIATAEKWAEHTYNYNYNGTLLRDLFYNSSLSEKEEAVCD